jgi:hypothetical protein
MKLALSVALLGLAVVASAADPPKPAVDPKVADILAQLDVELKAGADPAKLAAIQKRAEAAGVKINLINLTRGPNCYFMRTTRPLPRPSTDDAAKGPRFVPLQSRINGSTTDVECSNSGTLLKAAK